MLATVGEIRGFGGGTGEVLGDRVLHRHYPRRLEVLHVVQQTPAVLGVTWDFDAVTVLSVISSSTSATIRGCVGVASLC